MNELKCLVNDEELDRLEQAVAAFLAGEMDADRFVAARLQQGIYGQRQEGVHMVRIKVPGGRLEPEQLEAVADVVEHYSRKDAVHITTRQDLQAHYVPVASVIPAARRLAQAGLTTREACGNTVRNVTACPLAGVCPREHADVTPFMEGAVTHFLRNPLTQQMPRKFKISFSGCESDCAQGLMHDLAVIAVARDGKFGFRVLAAGGLGHKPHEAIVVEEFIEEKDLLPVMEAVIALHNRYSDRTKRAKSRIKFLVDRFGPEGFVEKYREEVAVTRAALQDDAYVRGAWGDRQDDAPPPGPGAPRHAYRQKQPDRFVLPLAMPLGEITVDQLRGLSATMKRYGLDDVRTTQDQNLMLLNVPGGQLDALRADLAALGIKEPVAGDNVVACPGTSTCRLGITSSTIVAPKLDGGPSDLRIRVSGCQNGCAQPETGDIGIYGEGKRLHGKLVPHYQMYFGGDGMAGGGLAIKGPSVPSARIEAAVARVKQAYAEDARPDEVFFAWVRRRGQEYFEQMLGSLTTVLPFDLAAVINDHGEQGDFKVLQFGGGECAAMVQVQVAGNFFDAAHERNYRNAFLMQRKYGEALACAEVILRLIGQNLGHFAKLAKTDDLEVMASELPRLLPDQARLTAGFAGLVQRAEALRAEPTEATLTPLFKDQDLLTLLIADFCVANDRQLDLAGSLPAVAVAA